MQSTWSAVLLCVLLLESGEVALCLEGGMLFPRESESRQIQDLDGMWLFRADFSPGRNAGFDETWYKKRLSETGPVIPMPVPSSFNDITTDRALQNFVGWVWYEREFFVASDWQNRRVVLRIGSAHYNAIVWINGVEVITHSGGHLPFEVQINSELDFSTINRLTIAINNTLTPHTLPPGTITYHDEPDYPPGYFVQNLQFDFFNYAGIHRKVQLYTTPLTYIDDITIETGFSGTTGYMNYSITSNTVSVKHATVVNPDVHRFTMADTVYVEVLDRNYTSVVQGQGANGTLTIPSVRLWWPYTMSRNDFGYQYTLQVKIGSDVYRQRFGFRTVRATDTQLLINEQPFYCHGAAKHEDSNIRGKGLDYPLIARDFNMLKWLGVNCFRTSHYPYAEQIMDQADEQGIVVIDECPGVGITSDENFSNISLTHHLEVMEELVRRDKNRPSAIIWSVANEPASSKAVAEAYFKSVIAHTRMLDRTRLVTFVADSAALTDRAAQFNDIVCVNRYFGWYQDTGALTTITTRLAYDLDLWYKRFNKPIIITEYGADTVPGQHSVPTFVFTEDYQVEFMREYHAVFDVVRQKYLVGEMVWNFADFMTGQNINRVFGNRKGVLTRERQPKAAGHFLRERYWRLINATAPV